MGGGVFAAVRALGAVIVSSFVHPTTPEWHQQLAVGVVALVVAMMVFAVGTYAVALVIPPYEQRTALRDQITRTRIEALAVDNTTIRTISW